MITKIDKLSKMAAFILLVTNFIVVVFCLLLFSLGLWTIFSSNTLSFIIQNFGGKTLNALLPPRVLSMELGIAVSTITMVIFFIAFMGLYGAVTKSQFLLFMYATLIFLLLLLECALTYYFSSTLVEKGLLEQDGQWTHALRLSFKCCDFNRTRTLEQNPPWSCCGVDNYPQNCTLPDIYQKTPITVTEIDSEAIPLGSLIGRFRTFQIGFKFLGSKTNFGGVAIFEDCQTTISHWLNRNQSAIYTSLVALHVILSSCSIIRRNKR